MRNGGKSKFECKCIWRILIISSLSLSIFQLSIHWHIFYYIWELHSIVKCLKKIKSSNTVKCHNNVVLVFIHDPSIIYIIKKACLQNVLENHKRWNNVRDIFSSWRSLKDIIDDSRTNLPMYRLIESSLLKRYIPGIVISTVHMWTVVKIIPRMFAQLT